MSASTLDNRYMEFRICNQLYAVPLLNVREVIKRPEITTVPNMPPQFEGMMNLRGQILGVFNVRKKLGQPAGADKAAAATDVVIVIEEAGVSLGMIVDEVTRVFHATSDMISAAPLKEDDPARQYIETVIQSNEELVLTVQVAQLLEIEKYKEFAAA